MESRKRKMINQVLIKQFLAGNQHAFNMLTYKWHQPLFNFCLRYTGDSDCAKDIVQLVLLKIYQKLQTLEDHSKFSSWIFSIARNLCLDEIKRKKHDSIEAKELDIEYSQNQENDIINFDIADTIKHALQKIPEDQREVIILKTYHDLKFIEIADILEISINTVKSRMYLGLKALRPYVKNLNPMEE
jgi:RNA polymerase sigma-70 factor (ECF subfamily)